jgi:hypothetical protein
MKIQNTIQGNLKSTRAPEFGLIKCRVLKEMPGKGIVHLAVRNAIIRTGYFPVQWKVTQIVMIPKLGKEPEEASSYRPISLLLRMSKIFEKAMLKGICPILEEILIFLDNHFVFDRGTPHGITETIQ